MPDISISEDQAAYVEALREQLQAEVPYGHVRTRDAVEYLIDHHREDGDLDVAVDPDAPAGGDAGAGSGTDPEANGSDSGGDDADGDGPAGDPPADDATDGAGVDDAVAALGDAGPGGSAGGSGSDGGGGKVEEMMNLLDAHDEVWTEDDSSGGKYSVELPDGTTEAVATKDDVRALLFEHYR
jgi:hypothetical protein